MEETITIKASYLKYIIDERNEAQAKVKELKYKLGEDSRNLGHGLKNWKPKPKVTGVVIG